MICMTHLIAILIGFTYY